MTRPVEGGPLAVERALPPSREAVRAIRDDPALAAIVAAVVQAAVRDRLARQAPAVRTELNQTFPPDERAGWGLEEWLDVAVAIGAVGANVAAGR